MAENPVKDNLDAKLALAFRARDVILLGATGLVASANTEAHDFSERIRDVARKGAAHVGHVPPGVDLILPREQVMTVSVSAEPGDHASAVAAARAEIDGRTTVALDALEIAVAEGPGGWVAAAAERVVCTDAREFAKRWGFAPLAIRGPVSDAFPDGPLFEAPPRRAKPKTPPPVPPAPEPAPVASAPLWQGPWRRKAVAAALAALALSAALFFLMGKETAAPELTGAADPPHERVADASTDLERPAGAFPGDLFAVPPFGPMPEDSAQGEGENHSPEADPLGDAVEPSLALDAVAPGAVIAVDRAEPAVPFVAGGAVSIPSNSAASRQEPARPSAPDTEAVAVLPLPDSGVTAEAAPEPAARPENVVAPAVAPPPPEAPRPDEALADAAARLAEEEAEAEIEPDVEQEAEAGSESAPADVAEPADPEDLPGPGSVAAAPPPDPRPDALDMTASALALAAAPQPKSRPRSIRPTPQVPSSAMASSAGYVNAPKRERSRRGGTNAATVTNAIQLDRINLLGVFGTKKSRRALVRLPDGEIVRVKQGTRVDGWTVSQIDSNSMRISRGGKAQTLRVAQ